MKNSKKFNSVNNCKPYDCILEERYASVQINIKCYFLRNPWINILIFKHLIQSVEKRTLSKIDQMLLSKRNFYMFSLKTTKKIISYFFCKIFSFSLVLSMVFRSTSPWSRAISLTWDKRIFLTFGNVSEQNFV